MRRTTTVSLLAVASLAAFVFYALDQTEPLKITSDQLERQGDQVFVQGMVRNTGPDAKGVRVEIHFFDRQGRQIARQEVTIGNLSHGTMVHFATPPRSLPIADRITVMIDRGNNMYGN